MDRIVTVSLKSRRAC